MSRGGGVRLNPHPQEKLVSKIPALLGLKKTKIKLDPLIDTGMLLMVVKGIRARICQYIYRYAKANNKYMKYFNKIKELSYLQYGDVSNLYDWAMSQKFPVKYFELIENTSQFNEDFKDKVIKDIFSKLMFNILKNYIIFMIIYHFYLKDSN